MPRDGVKTNDPVELTGQNSREICLPGATLRSDFKSTSDQETAFTYGPRTMSRDIVSAPIELMKFETRHLPGALKLSQEMGWPYRREDWEFAATVGQGLVLERAGEVIGTAMSWNYGQAYATAGMIIVTGSAQGGGNGSRLFEGLLQATDGRNVLLNSTDEGLALYKRRGFTAWGTVLQHQGRLTVCRDAECGRRRPSGDRSPTSRRSRPSTNGPWACPGRRWWLRSPMRARSSLSNAAGRIVGYAIARRFGRGYVVGPCAAESAEDARLLILAQLSKLHDQFVRIDVYAEDGLGDWLESLGLRASRLVPPPWSKGSARLRRVGPYVCAGKPIVHLGNEIMNKMAANLAVSETAETIDALVTPALLLDRGRLERNIQRLAEHAKKAWRGAAPAHEDGQEHRRRPTRVPRRTRSDHGLDHRRGGVFRRPRLSRHDLCGRHVAGFGQAAPWSFVAAPASI